MAVSKEWVWRSLLGQDEKGIVLGVVKPTVDEFEGSIETFHFLHHSCKSRANKDMIRPCVDFRVQVKSQDEKQIPDIRKQIGDFIDRQAAKCDAVEECNNPEDEKPPRIYTGDGSYGPFGWEIAKKIYHYTSLAAIARLAGEAGLGQSFGPEQFCHCMLNQFGHGYYSEANWHASRMLDSIHLFNQHNLIPMVVEEVLKSKGMLPTASQPQRDAS